MLVIYEFNGQSNGILIRRLLAVARMTNVEDENLILEYPIIGTPNWAAGLKMMFCSI
jgi:hypothetical protein